jgi:anhydro-N-acetylmuramic acid kinase
MEEKQHEIIGLMSGTSLDGLDIAHVKFDFIDKNEVRFQLLHSETVAFPEILLSKLLTATNASVPAMLQLDKELGNFFSIAVNDFIEKNNIDKTHIDAIASHGQTIFHQPENGFTYQIGCGSALAYYTQIPVINDFRTKDVIAGGNGAPLVPIGDFMLFKNEAASFLNIGGFCNISFRKNSEIIAFDCCPGNLPLNKLAGSRGLNYDANGAIASSGTINFFLLDLLNSLAYYQTNAPKSLGTEWLEEQFYPLLKFDKEIENNLCTVVEHIAFQISTILNENNLDSVFITGGGVKNEYLISRLAHYYKGKIIIPEQDIIDFKEAIIFGFLGALYLDNQSNNVPSVTGASKPIIGGVYHKAN